MLGAAALEGEIIVDEGLVDGWGVVQRGTDRRGGGGHGD